ncbi:MAG: type III pantothenate kinase [Candidatus Eisenbacteria bacterium]|uniref:Type III pantothenate kinase n=1 Tax=Eiseniibacteriota bacterium TaxID=2212470 RepID=A0A956LYF5_UNCEI|nr:type III pantothenate kinase [Candidatus Eisenbacteria bacterium]
MTKKTAARPTGRASDVLAIDVGNSHTSLGVFARAKLSAQFRLSSDAARTADELVPVVAHLLEPYHARIQRSRRVVMASVVPSLTAVYEEVVRKLFAITPVVVRASMMRGISLDVPDPDSVGADRVANAVAAAELYGTPAIVVDLGTTTNFDVVLPGPRYVGGAIAPGLVTSAEELFRRGARLPKVEIRRPERAVGRTTTECLQSGVYFGAVGQIDGLLGRIAQEVPGDPVIIATGGLAETVARDSTMIGRSDPALTLQGLRILEGRAR